MLNDGRIEELKNALRDEIYADALKSKPGAKKRYAAMKRYFAYTDSTREVCRKPCKIDFEGSDYISFCNAYTLALTTESCGEIDLFDTDSGNYPDVTRLVRFDGDGRKINLTKVFAQAKTMGYKLKKPEVFANRCLLHYDGAYFRIALLDCTFRLIDNGEEVTVYHKENSNRSPLVIKNDIGVCMVMPVTWDGDPEGKIIIELDNEGEIING